MQKRLSWIFAAGLLVLLCGLSTAAAQQESALPKVASLTDGQVMEPVTPPTSLVVAQAPTATPRRGKLPTSVPTNAPTRLPSATPSDTPTHTLTNTLTDTPTNTPTETPTNTPTDTATNTPTDTPTNTPTDIPTNTPTETPTDTPTETPTNTPTDIPTNTPTDTPTFKPTFTASNTPTDIPTNTPTDTPTATPTDTPSTTPTSTPTFTASNTPTDMPTNTPTATPTEAIPLGWTGNPVTANADWQPFVEGSRLVIRGIDMVLVPAGCFVLGNDPEGIDRDTQGVRGGGRQCFDAPFYISRTEVSNEQFAQLGCVSSQGEIGGPQQPRLNVTWIEANACALSVGMRLPTEAEWEYAARGPDALAYPWGNDWDPDNLVWEGNANRTTSDVGSRPAGASWVGALDMAGNVAEWTMTVARRYPYRVEREADQDPAFRRVLRGGSRLDTEANTRSSSRFSSPTVYYYNFVGFRLIYIPPMS
jgi:hypothetical protein